MPDQEYDLQIDEATQEKWTAIEGQGAYIQAGTYKIRESGIDLPHQGPGLVVKDYAGPYPPKLEYSIPKACIVAVWNPPST